MYTYVCYFNRSTFYIAVFRNIVANYSHLDEHVRHSSVTWVEDTVYTFSFSPQACCWLDSNGCLTMYVCVYIYIQIYMAYLVAPNWQ